LGASLGERNLDEKIVFMAELIATGRFDSERDVYNTPDSVLPRVRRGGKIIRPLRFYASDIERLFSSPKTSGRSLTIEARQSFSKTAGTSITFKKRRK
jgi:hypothetical protein